MEERRQFESWQAPREQVVAALTKFFSAQATLIDELVRTLGATSEEIQLASQLSGAVGQVQVWAEIKGGIGITERKGGGDDASGVASTDRRGEDTEGG